MSVFGQLAAAIRAEGAAALVSVTATQGSAPREGGARMVVRPSGGFHGTIGGGALEWQALALARAAFETPRRAERRRVALGPELGQCCGGRVDLLIETFRPADLGEIARFAEAEARGPFAAAARLDGGRVRREIGGAAGEGGWVERFGEATTPVLLFGAGHVGRALALALAPLPFALRWIDPRAEAFPQFTPGNATLTASADPPAELDAAEAGAFVVVMTHSHPLDLAIVARALELGRFGYVGLIGSATKRARFESRLRAGGLSEAALAKLVCPIGVPGIAGKEPAVIAASVAAQLLQRRAQ